MPAQSERLRRGKHVDQQRLHAEQPPDGLGVRPLTQRVGEHRDEVCLGARHRWPPVDALDTGSLVGDRVGEQLGTDVEHRGLPAQQLAHRRPPSRLSAYLVASALEAKTAAPACASARA